MTDTQTQTSATETAAPAGFDAFAGESLTAAERAYFESGGEKTDGLAPSETNGAGPVGAATNTAEKPTAAEGTQADPAPQTGDDDPGAIEITAEGKVARDTKTGRFVPLAALHTERDKRKAIEGEFAQLREKHARADERLAVLSEALKGNVPAEKATTETPPDPEKDVFGFMRWQQKQIAELTAKLDTTTKETQNKLASSTLRQHYEGDVVKFKSEQPQFDAAKSFLVASRHKELEALGVADAAERQQMIDRQEAEIAVSAYRNKQRAPEILYKLAVARGFTPPAATATQQTTTPAAEKLDAIAKGQAAAASLATAAGGPSGQLTMDEVANYTEAEFDALVRRVGGQAALRKMFNM
jgi:hypothetical protein